jgi:hypothetical protein
MDPERRRAGAHACGLRGDKAQGIVERTFGWTSRNRRTSRDYAYLRPKRTRLSSTFT